MKLLEVNYDAVQKAMEDIRRQRHDYYIDIETGRIIKIPVDLMERTLDHLYNGYHDDDSDEEVLFDSELDTSVDLPEEMFDELETAVSVIPGTERYLRIPERSSYEAFECMKSFAQEIPDRELGSMILKSLKGTGTFGKFKKALVPFAKERKEWNRYNAKKMRIVIREWLADNGIKSIRKRGLSKK